MTSSCPRDAFRCTHPTPSLENDDATVQEDSFDQGWRTILAEDDKLNDGILVLMTIAIIILLALSAMLMSCVLDKVHLR